MLGICLTCEKRIIHTKFILCNFSEREASIGDAKSCILMPIYDLWKGGFPSGP